MRTPAHVVPAYLSSLMALLAGGCATYSSLPLDVDAQPKASLELLVHRDPLPAQFGMDDVAVLALQNNPDLLAARAQHGIAAAQLREAGILPNPTVAGTFSRIISGPGTTNPITASLSMDMRSLLLLPTRRAAAQQALRQTDASVLWEEWQVIAKARILVIDLVSGEEQLRAITQAEHVVGERAANGREALASGDGAIGTMLPDLSAEADMRRQLDDITHQQAQRRADLNKLLGVAPATIFPLQERIVLPPLEPEAIAEALHTIVSRRPDLLALQYGYQSQEEQVRGAIRAQFPVLSLGVGGERDNTDVRSAGPQISFELPIFDRNQGKIAAERATRLQLHDEFTARLIEAEHEVLALLADQELLRGQLDAKRPQLSVLASAAEQAEAAYRAGDLDERGFVDILVARSAKEQEVLTMEQNLLEQQVAIATLLGAGMPPAIASDPKVHP
jgi:outer membrane protein TolC